MEAIQQVLKAYRHTWPMGLIPYPDFNATFEKQTSKEVSDFLERVGEAGLVRATEEGHITASALVVNHDFSRVLLMLHHKLGKWLQLGGHVDGDTDLAASALREAREESGRSEVQLYRWEECVLGEKYAYPLPFDLDVHEIPARKTEPTHFHYDLRFLCRLDDSLPIEPNEEARDLRWLTLDEARRLTNEESMLRQFAKLESIRLTCRHFQSDIS